MKKKCIIIDVENTLLDVVHRRHAILRDKFSNTSSTIEDVRNDPKLYQILGKDKSTTRDNFYNIFNKSECVAQYPAFLFENAKTVIENFIVSGMTVILISGRDQSFEDAIKKELSNATNNLNLDNIEIYFKPIQQDDVSNYRTNSLNFKKNKIQELSGDFDIIAYVGDGDNDVKSAAEFNIPSIILLTSNSQEVQVKNEAGLHFCPNWRVVETTVRMCLESNEEINKLRQFMTQTYADWMQNINFMISIDVTIASILCALSATILSEKISINVEPRIVTMIAMFLVFLLSFFSLIFCIRGFTAKNTSGANSGNAVKMNSFRQMIAIFFGLSKNRSIKGDALDQFQNFQNEEDTVKQASAHYKFFYEQYKTYDPNALWNHRFFSIRASNYAELYAERFASKFLIYAIYVIGIWITFIFVSFLIGYLCN